MSKKAIIKNIIDNSYDELLRIIQDGNFQAIKFALENLDENFSIQYRELLTALFKDIVNKINNFEGLNNLNKVNIINIIKASFDTIL